MAYDLRHTGEAIDAAVYAVERGSVVTENTAKEVALGEAKPASADAIAQELQKKVDKVDGKGLSTNDYTNEEKEQLQENTSGIAINAEKIAEQGEMLSKHGEDIAKNAEDIAKKANTTEHYPAMSVGVADNLRGRGEATEEEFTYRPSAGASNSISEEGVATMKRIKGNSLVWNQLSKRPQSSFTITLNDTEKFKYIETGTTFPVGTKCFVIANYEASENTVCSQIGIGLSYFSSFYGDTKLIYFSEQKGVLSGIVESKDSTNTTIILRTHNLTNGSITFSNVRCVNLTKLFGAGNEPTTIEEFYARIPEGVDMNVYNEGQLISVNANAIETTGFNQWDEKWKVVNDTYIRSANYIKVLPNTEYYINVNCFNGVYFYDDSFTEIGIIYPHKGVFTTPPNTAYIIFATSDAYGRTYKNDICINLSHSGVRDGEYEPYKKSIKDLSVTQKYFPNGMKSAGSVYDEITETEAIQRIGEVDLGSLDWVTSTQSNYNSAFRAALTGAVDNQVTSQYTLVPDIYLSASWVPNSLPNCINIYNGHIGINDPRFSDVESFKKAMKGVIINYALAKPAVTPIVTRDINLNYPVWDWGTERAVSDVPSAPFRSDIIYGFNAVDTIRTNKLNIEDILRRLAELEAKAVVEQNVEEE